jgi:hypothetical protein
MKQKTNGTFGNVLQNGPLNEVVAATLDLLEANRDHAFEIIEAVIVESMVRGADAERRRLTQFLGESLANYEQQSAEMRKRGDMIILAPAQREMN